VNSDTVVSYHHKMAICCLKDDEIESELKCKICDLGLCIFGCFKRYHTKARFTSSCMMRGVNPVYTSSR
jgi:hypothetical protein